MRIVSLVPSATEMLFALGLGGDVTAVTHECDHPPEARELPKVTRDVIGPGLPPAEIDRAVRELTEQGQAIYELDEEALRRAQPDLIVTQALCAVCAVSYEDVKAVSQRLDPVPGAPPGGGAGGGWGGGTPRRCAWRRWSGWTRSTWRATGRRR